MQPHVCCALWDICGTLERLRCVKHCLGNGELSLECLSVSASLFNMYIELGCNTLSWHCTAPKYSSVPECTVTHRCALQSVRQLSNIVIDCCQAQHLVSNKSSCQKTEWNNLLLFLFYLDFKICHSWSIIWFGEWIRISGHRFVHWPQFPPPW